MIHMVLRGNPPQTPPQTPQGTKQKEAFYRFLMLVPGTGHDPVTSCFSDTRSTN